MRTLLELTINGVFNQGFKRLVKKTADDLGVKGNIKNTSRKKVAIVLQGNAAELQLLLQIILNEKSKAVIHNHAIRSIDFMQEFASFEIIQISKRKKSFRTSVKIFIKKVASIF
jgi:acylphosphatase